LYYLFISLLVLLLFLQVLVQLSSLSTVVYPCVSLFVRGYTVYMAAGKRSEEATKGTGKYVPEDTGMRWHVERDYEFGRYVQATTAECSLGALDDLDDTNWVAALDNVDLDDTNWVLRRRRRAARFGRCRGSATACSSCREATARRSTTRAPATRSLFLSRAAALCLSTGNPRRQWWRRQLLLPPLHLLLPPLLLLVFLPPLIPPLPVLPPLLANASTLLVRSHRTK
jgi:hypothetical protein